MSTEHHRKTTRVVWADIKFVPTAVAAENSTTAYHSDPGHFVVLSLARLVHFATSITVIVQKQVRKIIKPVQACLEQLLSMMNLSSSTLTSLC
jgi:hypothetical protein